MTFMYAYKLPKLWVCEHCGLRSMFLTRGKQLAAGNCAHTVVVGTIQLDAYTATDIDDVTKYEPFRTYPNIPLEVYLIPTKASK